MSDQKKKGGIKPKPKKKVGNQSKYETHVKPYLEEIKGWYRNGLTHEQIAENLGIATSTLMLHKTKHSDLSEALKQSGHMALMHVENALFKSATGFYHDEVTEIYDADGNLKERKRVKKYQPPNTTAGIYITKNKDPKNWRDRHHVFQTSTVTQRKDYDNLSDAELEAEYNQLEQIVPDEIEEGGEVH
jgi:hypothetical protein